MVSYTHACRRVYPLSLSPTASKKGSISAILERLREELARRGARGIVGIGRKFRIMDDDGSKSLSLGEFKKAMRECSLDLTDTEMRMLFQHFDEVRQRWQGGRATVKTRQKLAQTIGRAPSSLFARIITRDPLPTPGQDGSGSIDFEEFVQGIRDPLSDRRRNLVHLAFNKIDKDTFIMGYSLLKKLSNTASLIQNASLC